MSALSSFREGFISTINSAWGIFSDIFSPEENSHLPTSEALLARNLGRYGELSGPLLRHDVEAVRIFLSHTTLDYSQEAMWACIHCGTYGTEQIIECFLDRYRNIIL